MILTFDFPSQRFSFEKIYAKAAKAAHLLERLLSSLANKALQMLLLYVVQLGFISRERSSCGLFYMTILPNALAMAGMLHTYNA